MRAPVGPVGHNRVRARLVYAGETHKLRLRRGIQIYKGRILVIHTLFYAFGGRGQLRARLCGAFLEFPGGLASVALELLGSIRCLLTRVVRVVRTGDADESQYQSERNGSEHSCKF